MRRETKPSRDALSHSQEKMSQANGETEDAQLSPSERVHDDVSSIALDRGSLAMANAPASGYASKFDSAEGLTDADVMLRVKTGDESAFQYLVEKYRRPMVNFM